MNGHARRLLTRSSWPEANRISEILRKETVGGVLVLGAAVLAVVLANSPLAGWYYALRDARVGPAALHLDLSVETWAADGLLAIFFFVVGLELKREFVEGELRVPQRAIVPVLAAVGGMVVPALCYVLVNLGSTGDELRGWAIPTATDIAFALAALAIVGTHLPSALRTFLLTFAVVDDLLAVVVIGVAYTSGLDVRALALALVPLGVFAFAVQRGVRAWWLLLPLASLVWFFVHASGVHATVAGVLLGFAVPVAAHERDRVGRGAGLAEQFEQRLRPISAGVAVPLFAFFTAGITLGGLDGVRSALFDAVSVGIVVGLVAGKTVGIFGTTYLLARFTHAELDDDLHWLDVFGVAVLAGIGFTVSLLIGSLAFGVTSERTEQVKLAVFVGSLIAAGLAAIVLRARNEVYRRLEAMESIDRDGDGIPDAYDTPK
jgi:Na+:H+ antiporter, NhaA family